MNPETAPAAREAIANWTTILGLIAGSYLLDGLLLAAWCVAGVVAAPVAVGYVAVGVGSCAAFCKAMGSRWAQPRRRDGSLEVALLIVSVLVQLGFMLVAPALAWYFVTVLFIVFAFAGLRLRPLHAASAVSGVVIAVVAIAMVAPEAVDLPGDTATQRVLVVLCVGTVLIRCTLIGVFGSQLRVLLARRWAETRRVLGEREQQGAEVAHALQDGLGQELTGTSLILSACARRLREEGHAGAPEVELAIEHLAAAIRKTRLLARAAGAAPGAGEGNARRPGSAPQGLTPAG
jgi:signal transduction histidine kinase